MTALPFTLHLGDCLEVLRSLPDDSVDAVVTDPPYGLSFMGKRWDYDVPSVEVWAECLRVLKPGGHLLAFAGTRTQHRMAVRIEDAGFEIRDLIAWVYGSGFPKSHDVSKAIDKRGGAPHLTAEIGAAIKAARESRGMTVSECDRLFCGGTTNWSWFEGRPKGQRAPTVETFTQIVRAWPELAPLADAVAEVEREVVATQAKSRLAVAPGQGADRSAAEMQITAPATDAARKWQGWGTALKPSLEPITVARKPMSGTVAQNVLQHGTGAINVDGCRVGDEVRTAAFTSFAACSGNQLGAPGTAEARRGTQGDPKTYVGRWPANLIHDGSDEVVGLFPMTTSGAHSGKYERKTSKTKNAFGDRAAEPEIRPGDSGSAARFFYCAKASKSDRDEGLQHLEARRKAGAEFRPNHAEKADQGETGTPYGRWDEARNFHPTVKPTDLMRYLCRLVTPPGGVVLDPFMGSGSTGKAAQREGFRFIGIERDPDYMAIARARIETALNPEPAEPEPEVEADNDNAPDDLFGWGGVA